MRDAANAEPTWPNFTPLPYSAFGAFPLTACRGAPRRPRAARGGGVHVVAGYRLDQVGSQRAHPDPVLGLQPLAEPGRVGQPEHHDVGLDGVRVERDAG